MLQAQRPVAAVEHADPVDAAQPVRDGADAAEQLLDDPERYVRLHAVAARDGDVKDRQLVGGGSEVDEPAREIETAAPRHQREQALRIRPAADGDGQAVGAVGNLERAVVVKRVDDGVPSFVLTRVEEDQTLEGGPIVRGNGGLNDHVHDASPYMRTGDRSLTRTGLALRKLQETAVAPLPVQRGGHPKQ